MIFSQACNYGIRAALYVASLEEQKFVPIRDIAEKLDISFHFLTKILQKLTLKNIMVSYRGPNGGISLAKPAEQITLLNVIEAIDGPDLFTECILGLPGCGVEQPCPLHDDWANVRTELKATFENTNLADLSQRLKNDNLRLNNLPLNNI